MPNVKFRSGLEERMSAALGNEWLYEPYRLPYIIHKKYIPDFVHEEAKVLIECKGFFRVGDTQKYTSIRDELSEWRDFWIENLQLSLLVLELMLATMKMASQ